MSYVSLVLVGLWVLTAIARPPRIPAIVPPQPRNSRTCAPSEVKFTNPDPATVETLVSELAHPEPRRVLYAIDLLDAMDKRSLVTPLLLCA